MSSWRISATIYYWPGSFPEQDVKEIHIDQEVNLFSLHAAGEELDRIIKEKITKLDFQGFRTRYDNWKVEPV